MGPTIHFFQDHGCQATMHLRTGSIYNSAVLELMLLLNLYNTWTSEETQLKGLTLKALLTMKIKANLYGVLHYVEINCRVSEEDFIQ